MAGSSIALDGLKMAIKAGDWVEVRSKEEILATLDKNGRLDGMPLMPQMLEYCGQRFHVFKRAHKTCDTVNMQAVTLRVPNGIHLGHRCNGKAYGGCQAECLIFWKEAWLKPTGAHINKSDSAGASSPKTKCTIEDVMTATRTATADGTIQYTCQATELLNYSFRLKKWDVRQYVEDYQSKNASLRHVLRAVALSLPRPKWLRRPARWLYKHLESRRGWLAHPRAGLSPRTGLLKPGEPVPDSSLNLQPGEIVRVKSLDQILATINSKNKHRGLGFDVEMIPYCGRTYRVRSRVSKFIDERTGVMKTLKTPAVILEGVTCSGHHSYNRWLCPRAVFAWWREVWLERIAENKENADSTSGAERSHGDTMAA